MAIWDVLKQSSVQYLKSVFQKQPQQTFKVGEGLTPQQRVQAEETVKKISTLPSRSNLLVEAGRAVPRSLVSFALPIVGKKELTPEQMSPSQRFVLGLDTVKSPGARIESGAKTIQSFSGGKVSGLPSYLAAGVGVAGMTTLDTFFGGGSSAGKAAAKGILKEITEQVGKEVAEKVAKNVVKETAELYAKKMVSTTRNRALQSIKNKYLSQATKTVERGFVGSVKKELPEISNKVAGQYIPRETDTLAIKARNLVKDNLEQAEKVAQGTDDKAIATTSELLKHYNDEALKATDPAVKDVLLQKAAGLANIKAAQLTEMGRSVQAASILGRLTPEGQVRFAAREIQRYNEAIEKGGKGLFGLKNKIPELTSEQQQFIVNEMKTIQGMTEGVEKAMKFQKLQNYITDLVPTPLTKKLISIWKAGLLTGFKTSGLNVFSNISHGTTEIVKDIPASMVDRIASLFTKKRTLTFTTKGEAKGGIEGLQKGLRYLKTGFDERNIGTKLDYKRLNFGKGKLAKGLQAYTDTVFRVLGTEDQPFYYAAKVRSLYGQAKAKAINKGLKGKAAQGFIDDLIQNPIEQMIKNASYDAEVAVFQNKTLLGQAAKKIQQIPGGEVIVPFGRTPSAVAMQILNYSPVGIVKAVVENIGKGRFNQRLFSQAVGRGLTGTGALAIGGALMANGLITLDMPTSEKERELWRQEGKKPNAIKIGGKWRSAQILGPIGNVLLIGGHFQNEFANSGSPTEAIANALAGSSKSFSEQTFLTGISNFIEAISDPARSAEYVAGSTLASTIPTLVSDIARATDTKERRAQTIMDKFQARIPGVRQGLEPYVNVLGQEQERIGNPLEVMFDPTRPSPEKSNPVTQELQRLWDSGFKVSPTLLGDKKGYAILTPKQNTELWVKSGQITNDKLQNLLNLEQYQKLPDDKRAKVVEDIVANAKLAARVLMIMELMDGLSGDELKNKLSELKASDLMTREVFNNYMKLK